MEVIRQLHALARLHRSTRKPLDRRPGELRNDLNDVKNLFSLPET